MCWYSICVYVDLFIYIVCIQIDTRCVIRIKCIRNNYRESTKSKLCVTHFIIYYIVFRMLFRISIFLSNAKGLIEYRFGCLSSRICFYYCFVCLKAFVGCFFLCVCRRYKSEHWTGKLLLYNSWLFWRLGV